MNMNKEYRRELRQLGAMERKLKRDGSQHFRALNKARHALDREQKRTEHRLDRENDRIMRRKAVLEGRLQ